MHFAQAAKACVSNILQMSKFNFQKSMNDVKKTPIFLTYLLKTYWNEHTIIEIHSIFMFRNCDDTTWKNNSSF